MKLHHRSTESWQFEVANPKTVYCLVKLLTLISTFSQFLLTQSGNYQLLYIDSQAKLAQN